MNIVIDAYNLLKQLTNGTIGEREHKHFITSMQLYSRKKHHNITIVFDGGSYQRPFLEDFDEVMVVYSGYEMTADDYIKKLLPKLHPNNALIVTADRAICKAADAYNIASINPPDFMRFVHKAVNSSMHATIRSKEKPTILKHPSDEPSSIDTLMEAASHVMIDKDCMIEHEEIKGKKSPKNILSKTERKLEALIKKL